MTKTLCIVKIHIKTQSVAQDSIDTLIDVLNTQVFAEDQIEDTRGHVHISILDCHSRIYFQRNSNFIDCHSSFPVDPFDHNSTSASVILFEASIPEVSYRLPYCGVISSLDVYFSVFTRQCWNSDLLPTCVLCKHVSRSCQCSRSTWRLSFSIMGVGPFESVRFFPCTSSLEKFRHWSTCKSHCCFRIVARKILHFECEQWYLRNSNLWMSYY